MTRFYLEERGATAAPDVVRAARLSRQLDIGLIEHLNYLKDVCTERTSFCTSFLSETLIEAESHLRQAETNRLSGTLVAAYTELEYSMRTGAPEKIEYCLNSFRHRRIGGNPLTVSSLSGENLSPQESLDVMEVFMRELSSSGQASNIFVPEDREAVGRSLEAIQFAMTAINRVAPELYDEISRMITDIVIIDSTKTNAASTFSAFGVIVLKFLKPHQTWTTYVEHIVHEAAHHLLFAIFSQYEVFAESTDRRFKSPLRSEPRPLDAIFHATFVLCRVIYILKKMCDSSLYPDFRRTAEYTYHNPADLIDQFLEGHDTLDKNAVLTKFGELFLESSRQLALECRFNEKIIATAR